jgi:hypothetical protein
MEDCEWELGGLDWKCLKWVFGWFDWKCSWCALCLSIEYSLQDRW